MITITDTVPSFSTYHQVLNYVPDSSLFFDIETTGFSARSSSLYLIGIIYMENSGWKMTQWLAENKEEELQVLSGFLSFCAPYDTLIHFNGTTFDLPYLREKIRQYQLPDPLSDKASLDLYRIFRPLGKLLELAHMNQTALQAFLGDRRADTMDGKALISVYQKFASGQFPSLREALLLHNREDILGMTSLLRFASYPAFLQGGYSITRCEQTGTSVSLSFQLNTALPQGFQYKSESGDIVLRAEDIKGTLLIPCFCGELYHFFPNFREYCYLPLEDQAIHKSVAMFVDKAHRTAAKPANCYVRKTGCFLPQPEEIFTPVFLPSYKSGSLYFEYLEEYSAQPGLLQYYVQSIFNLILKEIRY